MTAALPVRRLRLAGAAALLLIPVLLPSACRPTGSVDPAAARQAASEDAARRLGYGQYAPYDNTREREQFYARTNRERAREFSVPRLQRRLAAAAANPGALERAVAVLGRWLDETCGPEDAPHPDAAARLDAALAAAPVADAARQPATAGGAAEPAEIVQLRRELLEHGAEVGWNPAAMDSPVAALRETLGGVTSALQEVRDSAAAGTAPSPAEADSPPGPGSAGAPARDPLLAAVEEKFAGAAQEYLTAEMFTRATPDQLPAELRDPAGWTTDWDQPEIGSDDALKGGTYREFILDFPPTIRRTGPNSNNSFRSYHFDNIELGCIGLHPNTGAIIPMLCDRWHTTPEGRTVFFHIDERATWSDGQPVVAEDFFTQVFLQMSPAGQHPFGMQFFREQYTNFTIYDPRTFAVTMRVSRPVELAPYYASLTPSQTAFFSEVGPDFPERYQWRPCPTTGAYEIRPEDIQLNHSITLSRVQDWWRRDLKYSRNTYNADRMEYRVVRDQNKAWELFRNGEFEYFPVGLPEYWYDKSEMPAVFDGYVERAVFYNVYPRVPWGLYLNCARPPLDNRDVRIGIAFACDWEQVIAQDFRGDARRLPAFATGYALIPDTDITPRPFDPTRAREAFARAGYTQPGSDGILRNAAGQPLSVSLTLTMDEVRQRMMRRIAESARRAGLEIRLNVLDGTAAYREVQEKKFQMTFTGWGFQPPVPDFYQYLNSSMAYEANGTLKQNTNNVFSWRDPVSDRLTQRERAAGSMQEVIAVTQELNRYMDEQAMFIPGYMTDFARVAYWRWMRWPEDFSVKAAYIPVESFVWWIDEDRRHETLEARAAGRTFPEVLRVHDQYRQVAAGEPVAPDAPLDPAAAPSAGPAEVPASSGPASAASVR